MAEITSGTSRQKKTAGVHKSKKHSTRVDLTPMVDLGFLLITFFIFTTTMSQAHVMRVIMPDESGEATPTKESGAITLLLGDNNVIKYYEGKLHEDGTNVFSASVKSIRDVILDKKRRTDAKDMVVIIKPGITCTYKDVVDVLDEMTINDVRKYAIVDITNIEESLVDNNKPDR